MFSLFLTLYSFAGDKSDDGSEKCFNKAVKNKAELIKNFTRNNEWQESCSFSSMNDGITYYRCEDFETKVSGCNGKPQIDYIGKPIGHRKESLDHVAKINQENEFLSKKCLVNAGVDLKKIEGAFCFYKMSNSGDSAFHVCKDYMTMVSDCRKKTSKVMMLKQSVQDWDGRDQFMGSNEYLQKYYAKLKIVEECMATKKQEFKTPISRDCKIQIDEVGYDSDKSKESYFSEKENCFETVAAAAGSPAFLLMDQIKKVTSSLRTDILVSCPNSYFFLTGCPR